MSRWNASTAHAALVVVFFAFLNLSSAGATDFVVQTGVTKTTTQTLTNQDTLTIQGGGGFDLSGTAITISGASAAPGITIDNSGTIKSGTRGIDASSGGGSTQRTITFTNEAGARLESTDDGFRINADITQGTVTVNNYGSILSHTGQAFDFNAIKSLNAVVSFHNYASGTITAEGNDAIRAGSGTISIINEGMISSVLSKSRGINIDEFDNVKSVTIENAKGATIQSIDDAIRVNSAANTSTATGSVLVDNAGLIASIGTNGLGGQAIDFDHIVSHNATVTINNRATGEIRAEDADAIRPGEGGVVNNWGKIIANASGPDESNDGIDFQGHAGTVNNYTGGTISGAHHGITSDVDVNVFNAVGATITGRNGSGVGSDGNGTVVNYGTITGAIDTISVNGDGDGVDIDLKANITNYGTIQGVGAKGAKDGSPNSSEGIAAGGGTIINATSTSVISGKDNAILIDDSNAGSAPFATQITNYGTIRGENGFGIRIVGTQNDTLTNAGLIEGTNGSAVDLGGGDDTLIVKTGGKFIGLVDGGAGSDTVELDGSGTFAGGVNFEVLDVKSGDWTLTGTQSYSNGATLESGHLSVDGTLDAALTTNAGTILSGNGTIGSASIFGTIAPGHSIGKLTFTGDYQQHAGSTYEVEINPAGRSDLIDIKGAATLAGSVVVNAAPGQYQLGSRYTILTAANGVSGSYDSVTGGLPFIAFALAYDVNDVFLDVTRNSVTFRSLAQTANQRSVGTALDNSPATNPVVSAVANSGSDEQARAAFNTLSGEIFASAKTVMLEDTRFLREAVTGRVRNDLETGRSAGGIWGQAFGSQGTYDGNGDAAGLDRTIGGVIVGVDQKAGDYGNIGLATGYSHASVDSDGRSSSQERDDYHVALYGGTRWGALGFRVGAGYTLYNLDTRRNIDLPTGSSLLKSNERAGAAQVFGELGYRAYIGGINFEPFAGIAYVNLNSDNFKEHGGDAALTGSSDSQDLPTTTVGLRAETSVVLRNEYAVNTHGMIGWRHAIGDIDVAQTLAFSGGPSFSIEGVPLARDTLMLGAGFDVNFSPNLSAGLSYSGELGDNIQDHGVKGNLSWKF